MISIIINIFVTIVILFALMLTNNTAEKANGNILLGASLPYSELKNKEVLKIIQDYHRTYILVGVIFFILILPLLIFSKYVSISTLYILFWCCLIFYINSIIKKSILINYIC